PLDPGFTRNVQGDERLSEFITRYRVQQEQRPDAFEGSPQRVDVEQFSLNNLNGGRETCLGRITHENANIGVACHELINEMAADAAGCTCDENGHGRSPWFGLKDFVIEDMFNVDGSHPDR